MENPASESQTEDSNPSTTFRGQTWDTAAYAATGRFVADLAGPVVELLNPQPGEAILDLGCGDGELTERIAPGVLAQRDRFAPRGVDRIIDEHRNSQPAQR